ncbi:MAG: hypothetical protein IKK09_06615 [Clostridia bacterium]|nr:hypothetical protein [Clostridia bacterium]
MAYMNENIAYDLDRFSSAAPKKEKTVQQPAVRPTLVKPQRKTEQEIKAERRFNLGKIAKFMVVAAVCFTFIASNINYRVQINELNGAIVSLDKELNEKKSENTRLNMALNSKISLENVQDYAENVLGMVKRERYQIIYFDLETGNEIIPAQ